MKGKTNKRRGKRSFMDSPVAIVLSVLVIVIMIVGFIVAVASGVHIGPVAAKNLFTAIALVVMFLVAVIVGRRKDKYGVQYVLPDSQRSLMGISSIFIFIGLLILFAMVFDNFPVQFLWIVASVTPLLASALIVFGVRNRRKAKTNRQYNTGCWLQWLGIWMIVLFVLSLLTITGK